MKDIKKTLLNDFRKDLKPGDKLEKLVVDFALRKTAGSRKDLDGVYYSKNGRHVLMASKGISGKYTVCEGVREIDADSFWGCAYLEEIVLPDGLEKIGHEAFGKCISLREITIPESLKDIGVNPFIGLNNINVKSNSPYITCDGKAVYADGGKQLVSFISDDDEFIVPEGVESIGEKAFSGKKHLCRIVLPHTLTVIDDEAFFDCDAMISVNIPESVSQIGSCSFGDCLSLRKVVFDGVPLKMKRSMLAGCEGIREISIPADSIGKFKKLVRDFDDRVVERVADKKNKQDKAKEGKTDNRRKSPMYK